MALVMSLNESITQAAPGVGILLGGLITPRSIRASRSRSPAPGSLIYAIVVWRGAPAVRDAAADDRTRARGGAAADETAIEPVAVEGRETLASGLG